MEKLNPSQLKAFSEFMNMIAAAWFTSGVIAPLFAHPNSFIELLSYIVVGLLMTWATMFLSLSLVKEIQL
ncbi:MAG: hypothetical protein QME05_03090 [Candidatus Margulisbacteria bacterium]|nr:hypothetical protein [Candidatus Margulisiibacteriota bacterium]